jgi:hypothetical protein
VRKHRCHAAGAGRIRPPTISFEHGSFLFVGATLAVTPTVKYGSCAFSAKNRPKMLWYWNIRKTKY